MGGIPVELMYLFVLLISIVVVFVIYKRPIYEAMFVGYVVMVAVLGSLISLCIILLNHLQIHLFMQ